MHTVLAPESCPPIPTFFVKEVGQQNQAKLGFAIAKGVQLAVNVSDQPTTRKHGLKPTPDGRECGAHTANLRY